jgi:hypothetical protein
VISATGRQINSVTWRPATIVNDLPQPLSGDAATAALAAWNGARSCTNVSATPGTPVATVQTETSPASPATVQSLSTDSG